jgi:hypothetical protein
VQSPQKSELFSGRVRDIVWCSAAQTYEVARDTIFLTYCFETVFIFCFQIVFSPESPSPHGRASIRPGVESISPSDPSSTQLLHPRVANLRPAVPRTPGMLFSPAPADRAPRASPHRAEMSPRLDALRAHTHPHSPPSSPALHSPITPARHGPRTPAHRTPASGAAIPATPGPISADMLALSPEAKAQLAAEKADRDKYLDGFVHAHLHDPFTPLPAHSPGARAADVSPFRDSWSRTSGNL